MQKVNFQDGTKVSSAKVTIDEVDYPVTPARYTGATPLSSTVMNTMQTNIENAINQNVDNIGGEDYDNTATYEEGDIVKYEGQLYICIEAVDTPEEWDSTKWSETDVLSSAGGNEVTIGAPEDVTGKTKIFINEEEGTDAIGEEINYTVAEQQIGTWISGEPLYRKVIDCGALPNAGRKEIAHNINNLDLVIHLFGMAKGQYSMMTLPSANESGANYSTRIEVNDTNVVIIDAVDRSSFTQSYLILEYTKTSD